MTHKRLRDPVAEVLDSAKDSQFAREDFAKARSKSEALGLG